MQRSLFVPDRNQVIGASEVPVILGLSPWNTPWDIWARKLGIVEEDKEETESQQLGHLLEGTLEQYVSYHYDIEGFQIPRRIKWDNFILHATLDGLTKDGIVLEFKTTGIAGRPFGNWGPDYSDEVPDHVFAQVQAQLQAAQSTTAHVIALIGGMGLRTYVIERNDEFWQECAKHLAIFWGHVESQTPVDSVPTREVLFRLKHQDGYVTVLESDEAIQALYELETVKAAIKEMEKRAERLMATVIATNPTASAWVTPNNDLTLVAQRYSQKRFDTTSFKAAHPELFAQFQKECQVTRHIVKRSG